MNSLLVFDYETTGLSPSRDRPVQFACVRTDLDFNITGKPMTLYCKPSPDHLPDPASCLITGIMPQLCEEAGLPEREFVAEINRELAIPGTIGLGYNSIAFDDEVTRFMFWRNLMDPYAREWQNGCSRWDLINLVRATCALRPETLEWPRDANGRVSFKLERLTAANGLLHESAHDALSDVYATIALARRVKERQPQLYAHYFSMRDKARALQEMDVTLKSPFIHVGQGASRTAGVRIMLPIARHPVNANEVIAWDLSKDPRQLLDIDAETVRRRMFTQRGERPEGFDPMPIHAIAANRAPAVLKNLDALSRDRAAELGIDMGAALANVPVMLDVLGALDLATLLQVVYARAPRECDPEEALYEGFVGNEDRRTLDQLRTMDPAGLAAVKPEFSDPRLAELVLRYKARHYPQSLSPRELDKWEEHRFRKLVTGYPGSRTVAMVRESVARCRQALAEAVDPVDTAKYRILDEVLAHANRLAAEIDPFETPVPAPPAPAPPAPLAHTPAQPDLFGGAQAAPAAPRTRPGRR